MFRAGRFLGWASLVALAACSSKGGGGGQVQGPARDGASRADGTADAAAPDGAVHGGDAAGLQADAEAGPPPPPDASAADTAEPAPSDAGPPPVAPAGEPEPVAIEEWLFSRVRGEDDPVAAAVEEGTFEAPSGPGTDDLGVRWRRAVPDASGGIRVPGADTYWAVTTIHADAPAGIVARADNAYRIWLNGTPQPADPYGSRRHRVPLRLREGENVLLVLFGWSNNAAEVQLGRTRDELYLNAGDMTVPDLLVGDSSEQYLGVAVLNLQEEPALDVRATVLGSDHFEETTLEYPSLAGLAVTQLAFRLRPRAPWAGPGLRVPVTLHVEARSLVFAYERTVELTTVGRDVPFRRTRLSRVDGSVQYYAVLPPRDLDPGRRYGLVLSLHGAGVEAIGQAGAYSPKDWAYIVAPTNRRPFGFDWEEWGRLDGIEALEDAAATFGTDPTRQYVTGHSMGGHGTWQFGVLFPGRFRLVGPSAGWSSFYSYGGPSPRPTGPFARARASSDTLNYVGNLARRAVFMIHGDADDNVPISEAYLMQEAVEPVAEEFWFHVHPGGGHWWDGDASPGADCVDWPDLFARMEERTLDPFETDFSFRTPSPFVNPRHSFVTLHSEEDPMEDCTVTSVREGNTVRVRTTNVRAMTLDGAALLARGVTRLEVDGADVELADGPIRLGEEGGKGDDRHGPFNQVFHRPFCFVYPDEGEGDPRFRQYASLLVSTWSILGNGLACAVPLSRVDDPLRRERNLIYLGVPAADVPLPEQTDVSWDDRAISIGRSRFSDAAVLLVFPDGDRLAGAMTATEGEEYLLFRFHPFSSRSGMPDYLVWTPRGGAAAGFFDTDWRFDPTLGVGVR